MEFVRRSSSIITNRTFNIEGNKFKLSHFDESGIRRIALFDEAAEFRIEVKPFNPVSRAFINEGFVVYAENTAITNNIVELDITSINGSIQDNSNYHLTFFVINNKNDASIPAPHTIASHTDVTTTAPTLGQVLTWDGVSQWVNQDPPVTESTTASNVGVDTFTAGFYKEKVGYDLKFRSIQSSDNSLMIAQRTDTVDLSVNYPTDAKNGIGLAKSSTFPINNGEWFVIGNALHISKRFFNSDPITYLNNIHPGDELTFTNCNTIDSELSRLARYLVLDSAIDNVTYWTFEVLTLEDNFGISDPTQLIIDRNSLNHSRHATFPIGSDDKNAGYVVGHQWLNTPTNRVFICVNDAVGSAVWKDITNEVNNAINLAPGGEIFKQMVDDTLEFRNIVSNDNSITVSHDTTSVNLSVNFPSIVDNQRGFQYRYKTGGVDPNTGEFTFSGGILKISKLDNQFKDRGGSFAITRPYSQFVFDDNKPSSGKFFRLALQNGTVDGTGSFYTFNSVLGTIQVELVDDDVLYLTIDDSGCVQLNQLTDTSITAPVQGHILEYNATSSKWENVVPSSSNTLENAGTGGISIVEPPIGSALQVKSIKAKDTKITVEEDVNTKSVAIGLGTVTLNNLADVEDNFTGLAHNNVLKYSMFSSSWINSPPHAYELGSAGDGGVSLVEQPFWTDTQTTLRLKSIDAKDSKITVEEDDPTNKVLVGLGTVYLQNLEGVADVMFNVQEGDVLTFSGGEWKNQPSAGASNTLENAGTEGISIVEPPIGSALQVKSIKAKDTKITVEEDVGTKSVAIGLGTVTLNNLLDVVDIMINLTNGQVLTYNSTVGKWANSTLPSYFLNNAGTAGISVVDTRIGNDFYVKSINNGSSKITVTDNTTDKAVDIDLGTVALNDLTETYAVGDILYANTTSTLAKLPDVATGSVLKSGGVGVAPSYGKVDLTTDVTGVLPFAYGGTNATSFENGIVAAKTQDSGLEYSLINSNYNPTVRWTPESIGGSAGAITWPSSVGSGSLSTFQGTNTTYTTSGIGGKPSILIQPATRSDTTKWVMLDLGANYLGTTGFTLAMMVKNVGADGIDNVRIATLRNASTVNVGAQTFTNTGDWNTSTGIVLAQLTANYGGYYQGTAINYSTVTPANYIGSDTTLMVFRYNSATTTFTVWMNKITDSTRHTGVRNLNNLNFRYIPLGVADNTTFHGKLDVSEVIFWNSALGDTTITDISNSMLGEYSVRNLNYLFSLKSVFDSTTSPLETDDTTKNYKVGSRWINVLTDKEYICVDATAGTAQWKETTTETLASLKDTNITVPIDNQYLRFTGNGSKWEPYTQAHCSIYLTSGYNISLPLAGIGYPVIPTTTTRGATAGLVMESNGIIRYNGNTARWFKISTGLSGISGANDDSHRLQLVVENVSNVEIEPNILPQTYFNMHSGRDASVHLEIHYLFQSGYRVYAKLANDDRASATAFLTNFYLNVSEI